MANTILIIDDAVHILDITKHFLVQEGYEVKIAATPKEGIAVAQEGGIDLIILDIMMPDVTGLDVLKTLRGRHGAPPPTVILFTAKSRVEDMTEGMQAGAYNYLVKPTSREKLLETVKAALAEAKK